MIEHPPLQSRLTVAALVHWQGRFLLVEEEIAGQRRFNQPAGHVEPGENLIEAAHGGNDGRGLFASALDVIAA